MKELAKAMAKAQSQIKSALKEAKGQIGQNRSYKYADLTAIWDACKEALSSNEIAVIQKPDFDEAGMWLETVFMHSSGDSITGRYPIRPTQDTPQAYGSALTYAKRYSLSAMAGVVTEEDDDGKAASEPRREAPAPKPEADNRVKAEQWAFKSIDFIENCIGASEIDAYYGQNSERLAKLQKVHPDLFKQVQAAITAQREFVNVKDAAE